MVSLQDTTVNSYWTVFNFATGTVVGNRYLAPQFASYSQNIVDRGDFVYIIIDYAPSFFYAKYDPSTDSFVAYVEPQFTHVRIFANGSGNK